MEESPAKLTWQSCAKWLCALDILPSNHKVMMPDATLRDLAYTLRDGVLLCNIVTGKSLNKRFFFGNINGRFYSNPRELFSPDSFHAHLYLSNTKPKISQVLIM